MNRKDFSLGIGNVSNRWLDGRRRRSVRNSLLQSEDTEGSIGKKTLSRLLPSDAVVLEVGIHKGVDTEEFALLFPRGRIIGFEAVPSLFVEATRRVEGLANVTLFPLAIGSHFGLREFHVSSGKSDGSGSLLAPSLHLERHPEVFFADEDKLWVAVVPLDVITQSIDLPRIDLLWMDVQGAEGEVIDGAKETLNRVSWIYVEVAQKPVYNGQPPYELLKSRLQKQGFVPEKEFFPANWLGEGNVLFRRTSVVFSA